MLPTTTQTAPSFFEEACAIITPPTGADRWALLVAKHGVRPGVARELSPEEEQAQKWDRYNEPSERFDDGYDVERWGGPGR